MQAPVMKQIEAVPTPALPRVGHTSPACSHCWLWADIAAFWFSIVKGASWGHVCQHTDALDPLSLPPSLWEWGERGFGEPAGPGAVRCRPWPREGSTAPPFAGCPSRERPRDGKAEINQSSPRQPCPRSLLPFWGVCVPGSPVGLSPWPYMSQICQGPGL